MSTINWKTRNGNPFYNGVFNTPATFNKMFGELLEGSGVEIEYGKFPAVNISETIEKFVVECVVPGFEKEEIKINLEGKKLKISGEKNEEASTETLSYSKREFKAEKFTRIFSIPENISTDTIDAEYKNGVLYLTLPKISNEKGSNKVINIK